MTTRDPRNLIPTIMSFSRSNLLSGLHLSLVSAILATSPAAEAQSAGIAPPDAAHTPKPRTVWLVPSDADKGQSKQPPTALMEGVETAILSQQPVGEGSWQILISVDLPLVRPESLLEFSDQLAQQADRLASLGSVSISLRGTGRTTLIEDSRNAKDIAAALVELGREAPQAGEYFRERKSTLTKLTQDASSEKRRRRLVDHFHHEQQLLEWQHDSLMDELLVENNPQWMRAADRAIPQPQAVFLLRDDLGAKTLAFLEDSLRSSRGRSAGGKLDRKTIDADVQVLHRRLEPAAQETDDTMDGAARVLSATGYALFPVSLAEDFTAKDRPTGGGARVLNDAGASELANGSGFPINSRTALRRALSGLDAAIAIQFDGAARDQRTTAHETALGDPPPEVVAVNISTPFRNDRNRSFWMSVVPPKALTMARARRFFEGLESGSLVVEAGLLGELAGGATLETSLNVNSLFQDSPASRSDDQDTSQRLRVTVLRRRLDHNIDLEQLYGGRQPLDKKRWLLRSTVRLPRDLDEVGVLVEDLDTHRWGAAMAEELTQSLAAGPETSEVTVEDAALPLAGPGTHLAKRSGTARAESKRDNKDLLGEPTEMTSSRRFRPPTLQVVAPARDRLTGQQRFTVLLSTKAIRSVVFYLDDVEMIRDERAPFAATLDLGPTGEERLVRAVGYSGSDLLMGSDEVRVNRSQQSQGLRITSLRNSDTNDLVAEASLRLQDGLDLDRVEFFRNQSLLATMTTPPLRANVGPPPSPDAAARGDFVRVVAWLEDGSFIEDVRLLGVGADGGLGDFGTQVEVNLVQVFAVVNDSDGAPIEGLQAADFILELGGEQLTVERFSEAEQVPLDLALVVDSSESMWALMDDTRKAAARFLGDTLTPQDRAMVIDFDNTVRLVHPLSGSVFELIRSLSKLKASGATALYDSIIFALVNLEDEARNRRAVVLLTDGDDFNSRFEYGRVYESARFAGVPLYFLALSDFFGDQRRGVRKTDLEAFAKASGGRIFYVKSMEEILAAYGKISRELRSQYLLTFATEKQLSREELERVVVKLQRSSSKQRGGKMDVRWTVGSSR